MRVSLILSYSGTVYNRNTLPEEAMRHICIISEYSLPRIREGNAREAEQKPGIGKVPHHPAFSRCFIF